MSYFHFKNFSVFQSKVSMKVGTDAMLLGSFIDSTDKTAALDVGAGSGVLSLMVAQQNSAIRIDAVEIDELSVQECRQNFKASKWSDRLDVYNVDFLDFTMDRKYDLLFSNPPFYSTSLLSNDKRKAVAKHENSLPNNLFFQKASDLLTPKGAIWIIVPFEGLNSWLASARENNLFVSRETNISGKKTHAPNRVILEFKRGERNLISDNFSIRDENGSYTDEYIKRTKEFHGKEL